MGEGKRGEGSKRDSERGWCRWHQICLSAVQDESVAFAVDQNLL